MQPVSNIPQGFPPRVPSHTLRKPRRPKRRRRGVIEQFFLATATSLALLFGFIFILYVIVLVFVPIKTGTGTAKEDASVQVARKIAVAMNAYALDHQGAYPEGKTSTEVFQKLIDAHYVEDPEIFYLKMPGKTKATSKSLAADNVCFDATSGVTANSPDQLPIVFSTGYAVTYFPGDNAIRNLGRSTPFPDATTNDYSGNPQITSGVAVASKGYDSKFMHADEYGVIHFFIPSTFAPEGRTYTQLEP